MKKIKLNNLKKLGKELNELLFDEDNKKDGWVDIKAPEKDLTAAITEILMKEEDGELFVTEDDFEELSEKSVEIIKSIRAAAEAKLLKDSEKADSKDKKDKKKKSKADPEPGPEPEEENENADLIKQVEECEELIDLKKLVKSEEILAPLRKGIGIQKNLDKFRIRVLTHLNGEEVPKKDDKKKDTLKKENSSAPKGVGIIATIVKALEDSGKKGITREEVHTILVDKFPDRNEDSMMKTIKVQLPSRISKEKFEIKTLKDGKYAKA